MRSAAVLNAESPRSKTFLTIPEAAERAGFSVRHFRRIIHHDRIPVIQIRRKFFILDRDLQNWKARQARYGHPSLGQKTNDEPDLDRYPPEHA
jgi:excisionase family DNA binding protein